MVIDSNNVGNFANNRSNAPQTNKLDDKAKSNDAPVPTATTSSPGESVSLSSHGQSINKLETAIANSPDINNDRVNEIRLAIESGEYEINADVIAEALINEA